MRRCSVLLARWSALLVMVAARAYASQPNMEAAANHLQQARAALERASAEHGDLRVKAIEYVDQAAAAVKEGMALADRTGGVPEPVSTRAVGSSSPIPAQGGPPTPPARVHVSQPNMEAAIGHLQQARAALETATRNHGVFRLKAIECTDQAIAAARASMALVDRPGGLPPPAAASTQQLTRGAGRRLDPDFLNSMPSVVEVLQRIKDDRAREQELTFADLAAAVMALSGEKQTRDALSLITAYKNAQGAAHRRIPSYENYPESSDVALPTYVYDFLLPGEQSLFPPDIKSLLAAASTRSVQRRTGLTPDYLNEMPTVGDVLGKTKLYSPQFKAFADLAAIVRFLGEPDGASTSRLTGTPDARALIAEYSKARHDASRRITTISTSDYGTEPRHIYDGLSQDALEILPPKVQDLFETKKRARLAAQKAAEENARRAAQAAEDEAKAALEAKRNVKPSAEVVRDLDAGRKRSVKMIVFDVSLGAPLILPECPLKPTKRGDFSELDSLAGSIDQPVLEKTCVAHSNLLLASVNGLVQSVAAEGVEMTSVRPAAVVQPSWLNSMVPASFIEKDGILVGALIYTAGFGVDSAVRESLQTEYRLSRAQTRGAEGGVMNVSLPGLHLNYDPGSSNVGTVSVELESYRKYRQEHQAH
jgi:hypothetical protein